MERLTNSDKEIPTLVNNAEYWLEVYFKLKDIEDAEEQGLLLRLPCKVGDTVYVITSPFNVFDDIERDCEHYAPMINADRIRSMTDEELAMALLCVLRNLLKSDKVCDFNHDCKDCTLSWLQKESEE